MTGTAERVRLAELVASLSLATDLGLGQPMEHVQRSCLIAMRLADLLGLDEKMRVSLYYVALLSWVGCSADAAELAAWFGDDIALRAASYGVDLAGIEMLRFVLRNIGGGGRMGQRVLKAGAYFRSGMAEVERSMESHCEATAMLGERLGFGPDVCVPLRQVFERWDGKGAPAKIKGEAVALPMRLVHLAEIVEVVHRIAGPEAALAEAKRRAAKQFDPQLVALLADKASEVFGALESGPTWDAVIETEPGLRPYLTDAELDAALVAIADFADLKSSFTLGRSRRVSALAAGAAERMSLAADEVTTVRRAGLVHDLGRLGVSNAIWDKPGPLSPNEVERMRLHPYYTDRMLARPAGLSRIGRIAGLHHERLDASGYHRGMAATSLPPSARILAAADAYQAMTESRPYRTALDPRAAEDSLRAEVKGGRLDGEAVNAVLGAAGHRVRRRREWPAGLTSREIEILGLVARGKPNRAIAADLRLSPKTVGSHVEHIYAKAGVTTRAGAALFAMQHGLLPAED